MSRFLVTLGAILVIAGLLWPLVRKLGLGRLPGDFVIERGNFRLYLPLGTSLLLSALLTFLLMAPAALNGKGRAAVPSGMLRLHEDRQGVESGAAIAMNSAPDLLRMPRMEGIR